MKLLRGRLRLIDRMMMPERNGGHMTTVMKFDIRGKYYL